jgi:hypothetical protein
MIGIETYGTVCLFETGIGAVQWGDDDLARLTGETGVPGHRWSIGDLHIPLAIPGSMPVV